MVAPVIGEQTEDTLPSVPMIVGFSTLAANQMSVLPSEVIGNSRLDSRFELPIY